MPPSPNASTSVRFGELVRWLLELPCSPVIVAIDGPGGAGKTAFARRLVAATDVVITVLHTDEFARPDQPTDWWPRLRSVIEQLVDNKPATFEPYDWNHGRAAPRRTVEPTKLVVIEGVSSSRSEWSQHLSFAIWIETDAATCQRRGMQRDDVAAEAWEQAAREEHDFFAADDARTRANLVVDGKASVADPDQHFVETSK